MVVFITYSVDFVGFELPVCFSSICVFVCLSTIASLLSAPTQKHCSSHLSNSLFFSFLIRIQVFNKIMRKADVPFFDENFMEMYLIMKGGEGHQATEATQQGGDY